MPKRKTILSYCKTCEKWKGDWKKDKICPDCKGELLQKELPVARAGLYFIEGVDIPLPRVSSIIRILAAPGLEYWKTKQAVISALSDPTQSIEEAISAMYKKRDKAGMTGSNIHDLIEIDGDGKELDIRVEEMPQMKAYRLFQKEIPHKLLYNEKVVYSLKFGYAGRMDRVIELETTKRKLLIDWKTGGNIYNADLQLSAYKNAIEEMENIKIDGIAVVQLTEEGKYKFIELSNCFIQFRALLCLYKWQNKIE